VAIVGLTGDGKKISKTTFTVAGGTTTATATFAELSRIDTVISVYTTTGAGVTTPEQNGVVYSGNQAGLTLSSNAAGTTLTATAVGY